MIRIFATVAAAAALLVLVKSQGLLERTGLLSSCSLIATPGGNWGEWWACQDGGLSGPADLSSRSCDRMGEAAGHRYWRCPASLAQNRARV